MRYTRTQIYLDPDDHRRLVDDALNEMRQAGKSA